MNGNGTPTTIIEGLTGLPLAVAWVALLTLAAIAAWRYITKENHHSVMIPAGGALLTFYVAAWSVWPVLALALILLILGVINKVSPRVKHVTKSGARAMAEAARTAPPSTSTPPAAPVPARRRVADTETPAAE